MNFPKNNMGRKASLWRWAVILAFLAYTLTSFGLYCARTLNGEVANHILAGDMFGTPAALKERGVKPLYFGAGVTGWDGQFYYYMSNDILGRKDTPSHIDAPAYRYQRVGLSLYAATVATLVGREWVSPVFFFASYFFLILAATWAGARLFARFGANPALILLWSLSVGTQITLFNALPDAAADAFLILALAALFAQRPAWSVVPFALSGLSREVYALFPILILFVACTGQLFAPAGQGGRDVTGAIRRLLKWNPYYWLLIPGIVVVLWQVYVVRHFGIFPSEQAHGILGMPLASWTQYFMSGIRHNHLQVGVPDAYREAMALLLFLAILVVGGWIAARVLASRAALAPEVRGVAASMLAFVLLYASFGPTVMMHYSGYFKALAVFFFLIPLMLAVLPVKRRGAAAVIGLLVVALVQTSAYNMRVRILPFTGNSDKYTKMSTVTETAALQCFGKYEAQIKVNSVAIEHGTWISRLFGRSTVVVNVDLTNSGAFPFVSSRGFGSVFMSYHWVDATGKVVIDGERSAIPGKLLPGQTATIDVLSTYPSARGEVFLKLSPVQEGCVWFYLANPKVSEGFALRVKN